MGLHIHGLLTGCNVVHSSDRPTRCRASLHGKLHELLEWLSECADVREVSSCGGLTGTVVRNRRRFAILELHHLRRIDRRRNLLSERGVHVRQRAIRGLENLEAIRAVLLDRRLKTHLGDEVRTGNGVRRVGDLGLVRNTDLIGRLGERILADRILLVSSRRQVRVSIVHTGTDKHRLNREDVIRAQRSDHARLLKICLHLLAPRQARSGLRLEECRCLLLVKEGVTARSSVCVQNAVGCSVVRALRLATSKEGDHIVVPCRRLNHSRKVGDRSRHLGIDVRLDRIDLLGIGPSLFLSFLGNLGGKRIPQSGKRQEECGFHLCVSGLDYLGHK